MRLTLESVVVGIALVASAACSKPHAEVAKTDGPLSDTMSKYTIEELRAKLDERRNRTTHTHGSEYLDGVSDRDLVNTLVRREKMIFPHDLRKDFYEFSGHADYLRDSQSVAALVKPGHYHLTDKGITLVAQSLGVEENLCSGQSYFEQPAAAYCSGFVIGSDLIATAGHCVTQDWKSVRVVFGYEMIRDAAGIHLGPIGPKDVYAVKNVVAQQVDSNGQDFAILQTDTPIENHPPLATRTKGSIQVNEGVYTLGFPRGVPLKLADGAAVRAVSTKGYFQADLDTYGGNSGSPVINASSHVVEGILVRGLNDFRYVSEDKCFKALVCPTYNGCAGEDVTLISALSAASLPNNAEILQPNSTAANKALVPNPLQPITKQFSSGPVVSGSRQSFSGQYVIQSDAPPAGYKIGSFSYSLGGDRACNAWSICSAAIEGDHVNFRFSLQGHNEWGGSGQAYSTGTLTVTYVPL